MAIFNYIARDTAGLSISGTLTAASIAAAGKQLRQEGKFPVNIRPAGESASSDAGGGRQDRSAGAEPAGTAATGGKVHHKDIVFFTSQLAVMVDTGVPLADAIEAISSHSGCSGLKLLLEDVAARVNAGEEFSAALARHPKVFSTMYVAMVRAAEASGTLGMMLERVAGYLVDEYETRKKVTGALTYPTIMIVFGIVVTIFLMTWVLPQFTGIYAGKEAALPMPTRVVMVISGLFVNQWMYLLGGLAAMVGGAAVWLKSQPGRQWWASAKLRLPLIGGMMHKLYLARCLRTLGTLIGTGVSVLEAVQITRQIVGAGPFAVLWDRVCDALREGKLLSEPLFASELIPRPVSQMIVAGERTGKVAEVLERVALFSDRELKDQIKTTTALIEPAMITIMGGIIGFVVMALLLPIFSFSKVMAGGG